jgi:hypothetical protein
MSEVQELEFFILPNGKVEVQVSGVKGRRCLQVSGGFESILGGEIEHREFTREYDEPEDDLEVQAEDRERLRSGP